MPQTWVWFGKRLATVHLPLRDFNPERATIAFVMVGSDRRSTGTRGTKHAVIWSEGLQWLRLPARRSWFSVALLSVWLVGWIIGGVLLALCPLTLFAVIWLVMWLAAVVATVLFLLGQTIGVDVIGVQRGDLVIKRRAGPVHRTWRYSVDMITELRLVMDPWPDDYADANRYLPFLRQQWGTIRFDHGGETVHVAPGIEQSDAEAILDWLERRLPSSAVG